MTSSRPTSYRDRLAAVACRRLGHSRVHPRYGRGREETEARPGARRRPRSHRSRRASGGGTPGERRWRRAHRPLALPGATPASSRVKPRVSVRIAPSTYSAMPISWPYPGRTWRERRSASWVTVGSGRLWHGARATHYLDDAEARVRIPLEPPQVRASRLAATEVFRVADFDPVFGYSRPVTRRGSGGGREWSLMS